MKLIERIFIKTSVLSLLVLSLLGCATVKGWVGMGEKKKEEKPVMMVNGEPVNKFSENSLMPAAAARNYKRMTRQQLEEDSAINAQAGSMWVMEGQGAYLFAQNKTRREGDLLNVKVEGAAQQQIDTKVAVIKKLLKQLEDEEKKAKEQQQQAEEKKSLIAEGKAADANRAPAAVVAAPPSKEEEKKEEPVKIDSVPTKIVERQSDGNYRIKGQQPFMIGKREYKVLVTGVIRPEDFNDEGVSSSKILDPQYDVISLRRKEL